MGVAALLRHRGESMGVTFTTTKPSPEQLAANGFSPDRSCNAPLNLGCGVKGGAEILIASVRTILEQRKDWAVLVLSDDKTNGFNCISRKSIMAGLRRWFPELVPTFSLFYSHAAHLFFC